MPKKLAPQKSAPTCHKAVFDLTKDRNDVYVSTEVGQHQMWAAQYIGFERLISG